MSSTVSPLIREVMSRAVVTAHATTPLDEIISALHRFHVSALPVVDDGQRPLGVVSEVDLVGPRAGRVAVAADVMSRPAVTVSASAPLVEAERLMAERGIRRVVAVYADGRVAGIVSREDVPGGLHQGEGRTLPTGEDRC